MDDVVICAPLRTPVGRFGGVFAAMSPPTELAATVLRGAGRAHRPRRRARSTTSSSASATPTARQPAIGRVAALDAGLP